jgi:DNA polymerase-3 subunit delta
MVAVKTHQAEPFLKSFASGTPPCAAVLFYGTDAGLITERAALLAKRLAHRDSPPGEILRFDDTSLEEEPHRIAVELQTAPMFGGRKIVRATAGRRITAALLKPLLEGGNLVGFLIVEAGNLRPDDTLRSLFEKTSGAAGVACFPDEGRDLDGMVREVLATAKLQITPEAKTLLAARLGADRALSRAEVEKLTLYALGKGTIEEADVIAAVGDAAELALDKIIIAAGGGYARAAVSEYDRSLAAGESPQAVIAALLRHFMRLHRVKSALDAGRTMDDAMRQWRPPPHFRQKEAIERQCRQWSLPQLHAALARISAAAMRARVNWPLESMLTENLLLELAALARN